jgi:hypothetical protein
LATLRVSARRNSASKAKQFSIPFKKNLADSQQNASDFEKKF